MDLAERILQGKRQNEALKSELQRLIEQGLKGTSQKTEDSKESPEVPVEREPVVPMKDERAKKVEEPPRRSRSYDVEEVRRYMKEREKKRSENLKPEESKAQKDLRKKRLDELHKRTLELVSKNVKKNRSKSANRESSLRPDHFEVSRHKFASNEQILSPSKIRSSSARGKSDIKVPVQSVTKAVGKKSGDPPQNVSKRLKDTSEPIKSSTHSIRPQENVIPEARSELNFVIQNPENIPRNITKRRKSASVPVATNVPTDLDNLTLPETRLEPRLGISKVKNLPCTTDFFRSSIHSENFPVESQLEPHLKLEKLPQNVSKLNDELIKSSIHSTHSSEIMLPQTNLESNFIISMRDTIPQNISIRTRRKPETVTMNELAKSSLHSHSQDKPSVIDHNLQLSVPENLQNITKRIPRKIFDSNVNIPPFSPKICSTNIKTLPPDIPENFKDMKTWLHDSHDHPFNFVDTIKRKLDFTNLVDIGTQDSFPALDAHNIEHLNLVNNNNNNAVEKESDTSDTSKNIPDISTESGRSLKLNAESVKRNLSREFSDDDKKSLIESLRHNTRDDSNIGSHRSKSLRSKQLLPEVSNKVKSIESLQSKLTNNSEISSDKTVSQALCSKQYAVLPVNSTDFSNKASKIKTASHENSSRKSPVKSLRNKHEVFLKFEAEFHLLDAFRESLLNYSALEESLVSLRNQNNVDVSDIIRPPLREVQSPSYRIGDKFDQMSVVSTVNCSMGPGSEMSLTLTNRAESLKPTNDLVDFSFQMFEQLIKDEESRLKNIEMNLHIREKVLLDRTKTELACLEIDRKNLKAKGNLYEASVIKKKQRAIILNHQKEQQEIKVLKQMQKTASEERKSTLRQQEYLIKKQFCMEDVAKKMRSRRNSRERRRTGPLKIQDSMSAMSDVTRSSTDRKSVLDFNEQRLSGKDSDTQMVTNAINKQNEYLESQREQLKKILLMHEETLEKRRKATEDLLKWHRRLAEEEKRVNELESKANTVISRRKVLLHKENEKKHNFTGRELNQMWYTLTDNEEVKFAENKVYSLSQTALEKFCRNAKEHLMKAGKDRGDLAHIICEFKEEVQEEQKYQDESFEVYTDDMVSGEIVNEQEQSVTEENSTALVTNTENFVQTEVPSKLNKQISTSGNIVTTLEDILSRTEADLKQIVAQFEIRENTTDDVSSSLNQSNSSLVINKEMKETSTTNVEVEIQEDGKSENDLKTVSSIMVQSSVNEGNHEKIPSIIEDLVKSEVGDSEYLGVSLDEKSSNIEHNDDVIETVKEDTSLSVSQAVKDIVEGKDEHVTTIEEEEQSSSISSRIVQSGEISQSITENLEENTSSPLSPNKKVEHITDPNESPSSTNEPDKSQSVSSEKQEMRNNDSSLPQDVNIGDETFLISSVEENEKSTSPPPEEKSPKIEISDVKQRVHEIMDAHQVPKDRSPRVQDLYVTTYDLVSPTNSPDSGSPVTEKALAVASIFDNEAEELLKKQLAIEQEIKQITEQQRKEKVSYIYVREIPNKPPPPYTPPGSISPSKPLSSKISIIPSIEEVHDIVPSCARILHKAYLSKTIETVSISENTMNLILTNMPKGRFRFIFDLCKDIARRHYCMFEEKPVPSWLKDETVRRGSKPLDPKGLERYLEDSLRELFGFEKPKRRENSIIKWSRKKRDHVDEVLVRECQDEESKWTSCEKDKKLIMDQMVNEVMKLLIEDSCGVMEKLFRRTELKVE